MTCPFENCRFNCRSKAAHRARYSHISRGWKRRVSKVEAEIRKKVDDGLTDHISWKRLKNLGVLYHMKPEEEPIVEPEDP